VPTFLFLISEAELDLEESNILIFGLSFTSPENQAFYGFSPRSGISQSLLGEVDTLFCFFSSDASDLPAPAERCTL